MLGLVWRPGTEPSAEPSRSCSSPSGEAPTKGEGGGRCLVEVVKRRNDQKSDSFKSISNRGLHHHFSLFLSLSPFSAAPTSRRFAASSIMTEPQASGLTAVASHLLWSRRFFLVLNLDRFGSGMLRFVSHCGLSTRTFISHSTALTLLNGLGLSTRTFIFHTVLHLASFVRL